MLFSYRCPGPFRAMVCRYVSKRAAVLLVVSETALVPASPALKAHALDVLDFSCLETRSTGNGASCTEGHLYQVVVLESVARRITYCHVIVGSIACPGPGAYAPITSSLCPGEMCLL